MDLKEFVKNSDVEYTKSLVSMEMVGDIESAIGISFGGELVKYIVKYGYLAFMHIELYGVNSNQMLDSDMVKQTKYLHKYFPKTREYVALENCGEGEYVLVSSEDNVFKYYSESDSLEDTRMKMFEYILRRFQEVNNQR